MDSQQPLRATLVASLDSRGSISGSLTSEGADPMPFTGWLGLVGAINDLAGRVRGEASEPAQPPNLLGDDRDADQTT